MNYGGCIQSRFGVMHKTGITGFSGMNLVLAGEVVLTKACIWHPGECFDLSYPRLIILRPA